MLLLVVSSAIAATLSVGPSGAWATPCDAIAVAAPGDVIEVDAAGDYAGDTCAWSTDDLTLRGVNGRPVLDGTSAPMAEQKGIFVIHAEDATVENLAFRGASVADANGAGIRHQGTNLVVRDCVFSDNENGILGSPAVDGTGSVEITGSEFDHNGAGDGYSHNLYLGHYASVIFRASYSHRGNVGHLFKSRAAVNRIESSRLSDETGGAASYEIDLPNGGEAWIVGTVVEQVGTTQNSAMIAFGEEGTGSNTTLDLHIVNTTLVNHHDRGTFVSVGSVVTPPAEIVNTLFVGPGTLSTQAGTVFTATWDDAMGDPLLVAPDALDVHLQDGSPCVDAGVDPEVAPDAEYVHPAGEIPRSKVGDAWDIGAYEHGNPGIADTGDTGTADTGTPLDDTGATPEDTGTARHGKTCGCATATAPSLGAWMILVATLRLRRRR